MRGKGKGNVLAAKRSQLQARRHNLQLGSGTAQHNKKQENNNGREEANKKSSREIKGEREVREASAASPLLILNHARRHGTFSLHTFERMRYSIALDAATETIQMCSQVLQHSPPALTKCPLKGVAFRPDASTMALALWPPLNLIGNTRGEFNVPTENKPEAVKSLSSG